LYFDILRLQTYGVFKFRRNVLPVSSAGRTFLWNIRKFLPHYSVPKVTNITLSSGSIRFEISISAVWLNLQAWCIFVLSPEEASRICLCFWKRLSRKSNNVVVFPFAVQQPFRPLWSRLLLRDHEPSRASFALCFKSLLMSLLPASGAFLLDFLSPRRISLRLVPTLLICPSWETLLIVMLPPA
jgi:hypothetical protein